MNSNAPTVVPKLEEEIQKRRLYLKAMIRITMLTVIQLMMQKLILLLTKIS